jgi:ABC-type glycerol-3-phosphate transport system permease component
MSFQGKKFNQFFSQSLSFLVSLILSLILVIPFVWMVLCSFQSNASDIFMNPPVLPQKFNLDNYITAITTLDILKLLSNTMILIFFHMLLGICSSILVGYAFARLKSRFKNALFALLLSTMMLPWVVTMVPAYAIFYKLGLIGTFIPLILPSIGGNAFFIFLIRQFMMGIPKELDEAATIDGCGKLKTLFVIIVPLCNPIIVTMLIFSFTSGWSDYIGPNLYLGIFNNLHTLSIGLAKFLVSNSASPWHIIMAACVMFSIPMIVVMLVAQKAITRGIITTGLKG